MPQSPGRLPQDGDHITITSSPLSMIDDVTTDQSEETAYSLTITWTIVADQVAGTLAGARDPVRGDRAA